ncbi:MAG: 2-phospho-L-lactate guanylyltransferase [Thermomicrobiales bacterium]
MAHIVKPDLTAIIPLRNREGGKTRLAESFTPLQRERLVRAMAETVLDAVLSSGEASQIVLVTRDPVFAQEVIGPRTGVRIVHQPARFPGLTGALDFGRESATSTSILVLFADLPMIAVQDIRAVAASESRVVLLPDRHRNGTNGVLVRHDPDAEFQFRFGESSFSKHMLETDRLWWDRDVIERNGTATDLDTVTDWLELPERLRDELIDNGQTEGIRRDQSVASVSCLHEL